jgi:hypothetical protein
MASDEPAFAGIHAPSPRAARERGRLISTREMLVGGDDSHGVVVEHLKACWKRQQDLTPLQPVVSPAVPALLGSRLASGAAGAGTMNRG